MCRTPFRDDYSSLAACTSVWSDRLPNDAAPVCMGRHRWGQHLHVDHAIAAMEAGKHVVIEQLVDIVLRAIDKLTAVQRDRAARICGSCSCLDG